MFFLYFITLHGKNDFVEVFKNLVNNSIIKFILSFFKCKCIHNESDKKDPSSQNIKLKV